MSDESNLSDDQIETDGPTEDVEDRDVSGIGAKDTGDEPTEDDEDRDVGGDGSKDSGDQ